jgi:hypothetical protein
VVRAQRAGVVVGEDVPLSWLRSSDSGWDAACRCVAVCGVRVGGGAQALARCLLVGTGSPGPGQAAVALSVGPESSLQQNDAREMCSGLPGCRTSCLPARPHAGLRQGPDPGNGHELDRVRRRTRALRTQLLRQPRRGPRGTAVRRAAVRSCGQPATDRSPHSSTGASPKRSTRFAAEPRADTAGCGRGTTTCSHTAGVAETVPCPEAGRTASFPRHQGYAQTGPLEVQVATGAAASAARGFGLRGALGPFGQPCSDPTVCGAPSTFRCDRRRTRVPRVRRTVSDCFRGFLPIM